MAKIHLKFHQTLKIQFYLLVFRVFIYIYILIKNYYYLKKF